MSCVPNQIDKTGDQGSNIPGRDTVVPIAAHTLTRKPSRPRKSPPVRLSERRRSFGLPHLRTVHHEKRPTSPVGAPSFSLERTPHLRARAPIAKRKEPSKVIYKLVETKQAPSGANSDVHRGFDEVLNLYELAIFGQNDDEVWIRWVDEAWKRTLRFFCTIQRSSICRIMNV